MPHLHVFVKCVSSTYMSSVFHLYYVYVKCASFICQVQFIYVKCGSFMSSVLHLYVKCSSFICQMQFIYMSSVLHLRQVWFIYVKCGSFICQVQFSQFYNQSSKSLPHEKLLSRKDFEILQEQFYILMLIYVYNTE